MLGDGKISLRGGYGIYYGRISNSTISSAITNTGTQNAQRTYSFCYEVTSYCSLVGPVFPDVYPSDPFSTTEGGDVVLFAHNKQNPQIHQADLILERQVARNTVVSVSYLLGLGRELPNFVDTNLDPNSRSNFTYTFVPDYDGTPGPYNVHTLTVPVYTTRINPNFETITEIRSNVNSSYNALVVQLIRNAGAGLDFRFNYTWAHSLDYNQNSTTFTTYNNTLSPIPFTYLYDGVPHYVARPDYGKRTTTSAIFLAEASTGRHACSVNRPAFSGLRSIVGRSRRSSTLPRDGLSVTTSTEKLPSPPAKDV